MTDLVLCNGVLSDVFCRVPTFHPETLLLSRAETILSLVLVRCRSAIVSIKNVILAECCVYLNPGLPSAVVRTACDTVATESGLIGY